MKSTDEELVKLVRFLRKSSITNDAAVWSAAADQLKGTRSRRGEVNISRIARSTSKNQTVLIPGKVLGSGRIGHPVRVAAFKFSASAAKAIAEAGGECLSIRELVDSNPKGVGIKILG
ncbi:MAG: 50S ribosomal protein L18e [Candidatus Bathyarchaeota archaeon]|nr:MAG: 50S ribosomal protein L18e [Candidatus Bathyarchaeota archaeon]